MRENVSEEHDMCFSGRNFQKGHVNLSGFDGHRFKLASNQLTRCIPNFLCVTDRDGEFGEEACCFDTTMDPNASPGRMNWSVIFLLKRMWSKHAVIRLRSRWLAEWVEGGTQDAEMRLP